MIHLALILTHNKSDQENSNQIEVVKTLVTKITDIHNQFDGGGSKIGVYETYHYEFINLGLSHILNIYQILPYQPNNPRLLQGLPYEGVWPSNAYDIDSHKVAYGKGDEDKLGDHPRFFNWGLKRGTDYGAGIVLYIEDVTRLDFKNLLPKLDKLTDPLDKTEFVEDISGKIATVKLLEEIGQLNEYRTFTQAVTDLKTRVVQGGLKNG